jgi:hypothetical protein
MFSWGRFAGIDLVLAVSLRLVRISYLNAGLGIISVNRIGETEITWKEVDYTGISRSKKLRSVKFNESVSITGRGKSLRQSLP